MAEKFTMSSSLEEILNNERVCKKIDYIFSPTYYEGIRPMFRKMKLKNMVRFVKTPWGKPFPAEGLLTCANFLVERRDAGELISIPIWRGFSDEEMKVLEQVVLIPFTKPDRKNAPCVIICPGGGYSRVAFHREGIPVAKKLCEQGYQVFILNYRVYPHQYPKPLQDLIRSIRFVRKNSVKLGIDPENVTLMGFSAGAHLCALAGALYDRVEDETHRYDDVSARPNQLCLAYPVISFLTDAHEGSRKNFLASEKEEDLKGLSIEKILSVDYPRTFLWACEDDAVVPVNNTRMMEAALKNKRVDYQCEIFPTGGHGIGLGTDTSASAWLDMAVAFLNKK